MGEACRPVLIPSYAALALSPLPFVSLWLSFFLFQLLA